jgi:hypothetical protein
LSYSDYLNTIFKLLFLSPKLNYSYQYHLYTTLPITESFRWYIGI